MSVRLRKDQIDKASKDTWERFAADFSVMLVVVKPDDQTYDARDNGCQVSPSDHMNAIATSRVRRGSRENVI